MRVAGCGCSDLRREHSGKRLGVRCVLDFQNAFDALNRGRLRRDGAGIGGEYCDIDFRALDAARAAHALRGRGIEFAVRMLGNDENLGGHQIRPFCLSASTSPATSFTMTPFCRVAGGSYFAVLNCAAASTPRSPMAMVSSCFFFAFMMSGSFT